MTTTKIKLKPRPAWTPQMSTTKAQELKLKPKTLTAEQRVAKYADKQANLEEEI